jgi:hypothetical protein
MGPAQVGLAIQPTQKVRYVAQITGIVASSQYGEARAGTPLQAFFSLRQIIWAELVGTTFFLLVGVSRFSGRRRAALNGRTSGIPHGRSAVAEGRIAETIAADTRASIPLDAIRRPRDTSIWKLEGSFRCRSCGTRRYSPPVHMIKLTQEREITPYVWVHPEDDR